MRPIEGLLVAAALAFGQECAASPRGADPDGRDVHRIAWNKKVDGQAFRDQHGVCHTFARDTRAGLQNLGEQVKACVEGSLPELRVEKPAATSVKVAWNKATLERLNDLYAESAAPKNALFATGARRRGAPQLLAVRGFYTQTGDTCHVVVPDLPGYVRTLGHEFKHCVDGLFHDQYGEWIVAERG